MTAPLHLTLEFARSEAAGQPHGFRFAPQNYLVRSPGGGFETAELPWTRELLADLRALRASPPDPDVAHRIGELLREFLGRAGFAAHEQAIVAASRAGAAITVTVRSAAAELYALPWELLVLKGPGQMLGGIPGLVVRYEWPDTTTCPESQDLPPRRDRVLFAWSAAGGSVPAADHLAALRAHVPGFDPSRDVLPHASLAAIADALAAARTGTPVDVLHLLCHGATVGTHYGLALDQGDGGSVVVDAGRVQQLLAPHAGMLRTVVLAACDSGDVGEPGNHLGSVAQMLHRAGLRSVVASRYPLSAAGSTRFAAELFAALARRGDSLEHAFVAARDVLVRDPQQLDWASVQLYAREADGRETRPFARGPAARRRSLATLSAGLAAAGAIALAAALWSGDPQDVPEAPAEPAIVVAEPPRDPPPAATPVTPPIAPPPDVTAPPPTPAIVDPPGPVKKQPPQPRPPACRATAGACPAAIVTHLKGHLQRPQPPLKITVRCDGGLDYVVLDASRDSAAAADERRDLRDLGNAALTARHLAALPCRHTLK